MSQEEVVRWIRKHILPSGGRGKAGNSYLSDRCCKLELLT